MKKTKGGGGGVYGGRELPLKILQNFYCPHSIMVVAALGHSDTHFDYCFDWCSIYFLFRRELS